MVLQAQCLRFAFHISHCQASTSKKAKRQTHATQPALTPPGTYDTIHPFAW